MASVSGKYLAGIGLSYVRVNATADGDNTILEAVPGNRIVVLGYAVNLNAAGVISFKDGETVVASFEFPDGGGATYSGGPEAPAWAGSINKKLIINNAAGVDSLGHLTYVLLDR